MINKIKQFFGEQENKRLVKYFAVLFLVLAFFFNWKYVSFFFNYDVLGEGLNYVAEKTNPENALPILKYNPLVDNIVVASTSITNQVVVNPVTDVIITNNIVQPITNLDYLNENHYLEIPKLNLKAPIMFTTNPDTGTFAALLKKGTLHYPGSALPNQEGAVVILGHSSSPYWPKINYDWVFSNLDKLSPGDDIVIDFDGQKYQYKVTKADVLLKGAELHPDLTKSKFVVTLITCWPPGGTRQRYIIEAELSGIIK
ncbi:MAG: class E sortase [Candidatus Gribaldobacteria bacterium]|nr:class E sortase [Candidatus Gribaldobacteria bacterium]